MNYEVDYGPKKTGALIIDRDTAKNNSNVFHDEDNALYDVFLSAIEDEIEAYLGYPVLERENLTIKTGWCGSFNLPVKIKDVVSVTYTDSADQQQTIAATDYEVFNGVLTMSIEKPAGFVKYLSITCTAGYTNANMPGWAKNAALLMFSARDTYREDRKNINDSVARSILRPHRMY